MLKITGKKILLALLACSFLGSVYLGITYKAWKNVSLETLYQESNVVSTAAGDIEYRLWGEDGPVMLWLHGTRGSYAQYTPNKLSNMPNLRVLAVSRPGYLRTPIETGHTPEQQASAYAALLDELNIDSVLVMGVSGGGPSAIAFAAAYPERTLALILAEAVSQPIDFEAGNSAAGILVSMMEVDFFSWLLNSMLLSNSENFIAMVVPDPKNQIKILEEPYKIDRLIQTVETTLLPSTFRAGVMNDGYVAKNLNLKYENVQSPTLIIHGTADIHVPFEQSWQLSQQIHHAKLLQIEEADHFMMYTHMEEIDNSIVDFLNVLSIE